MVKLILILFFSLSFHAKASDWQELSARLDKKFKAYKMNKSDFSFLVKNGSDSIYSVHAKRKRNPASLTKIFTAAALLKHYSPSHQFVTGLYTKSSVKDRVLKGDLYLKGGGDPSFVSENMWFLVNEFHRQGIRSVEGDILVDDSLFDRDLYPSRSSKRVDRAYDAPISAMSFNWNSVNVFVRPGDKKGAPAKVYIDPENEYIVLDNKAVTGRGKRLDVRRSKRVSRDKITVTGARRVGQSEKVFYKSISHPSIWSGENLKSFLAQRGIEVKGKVLRKKMPAGVRLLAESKSKPLSLILSDLMKFSNNYVSEMLTKQLSLQSKKVGALQAGVFQIRKFIQSQGFSSSEFHIENASGLTRKNRVTTDQVVKVLDFTRRRFDLSPEFISSFPIAGVDGTLKSRMRNSVAENWVRAKTGLLSGVVGLAGYAGRKDGVVMTFAFIYNGRSGTEPRVRRLFDELATELVR